MELLLEAEVVESNRDVFEERYFKATGIELQPSEHYQIQPNKWGIELRGYFNDDNLAKELNKKIHVEGVENQRSGYRSVEYKYRFNDVELWWKLVENHGLRLGLNQVSTDEIVAALHNRGSKP
jgi:uncharacterized protein YutD